MLNEDVLWKAVSHRDPQWDGVFVYGVRSTGIYCRPTCPSRRPRRDRVRFFATPAAAGAEGFRACQRCEPNDAHAIPAPLARVSRACHAISARPEQRWTLARLAHLVGGTPHHLLRSFQSALGVSPREFADACRVGCLKAALREGEGVAAATYSAGYGSGSRVYERAASTLGMTPAAYARGGIGEDVGYAIVDSPLGRLLVAGTGRGLCAVKIGANDGLLVDELRREFSAARIAAPDAPLAAWIVQIVRNLVGAGPDPRLPLDLRATAFQRRVWRELQRIPRGATRSYREIARRIGQPAAARAVARACASNPVALVVPCHRVVRDNGALGGYRWGVDRKRALLEAERSG